MNQADSQEAMIRAIYEAFGGVTREGGISWTEAHALDDFATDEEAAAARKEDLDVRWEELLDDESWDPDGAFAWCYLDAVGFRYYLPAGMVRTVRVGYDQGVLLHLTLPKSVRDKPTQEFLDLRQGALDRWSGLDEAKRQCVRHFLLYMIDLHQGKDATPWREALEGYWERCVA